MIDGIPLSDLAPPTLLGIGILLVMFGRLVPWWFYKAKAEEAEKWRLAFEKEREARVASDAQAAQLTRELSKTTNNMVAVFGEPPGNKQAGEAYVVPTPKRS